MKYPHIKQSLILFFLALQGGMPLEAQVATISLLTDSENVAPGEQVTVEIIGDFAGDATFGGGIDVAFDPDALEFVSYVAGPVGLLTYRRDPDVSAALLSGLAFGDFIGIGIDSAMIGTLVFEVPTGSAGGNTDISLSASAGVAGPFASALTFELQPIVFANATVNVTGWRIFEDGFEGP